MSKRPLSPTYIFFYLLFWPDTWRILIGLVAAFFLAPRLMGPDGDLLKTGTVFVMLAAIGYAASPKLAGYISTKLRELIIGNRK